MNAAGAPALSVREVRTSEVARPVDPRGDRVMQGPVG